MLDETIFELDLPEEERWENLTLANDFLFGKIFQDPDLCLKLVKIILPELNIERVTFPVLQKSIRETFETKGVRFDVYLRDNEDRIINVEMQPVNRDNLMKRTRAYHSLIDLDTMDRESVKNYSDMPEVIVIFICGFDLFKLGRHIYTFRNYCVQERDLMLNDGTETIFLNTKGNADDISPKLKSFLDLVNGKSSNDDFVNELERRLEYAKQNRKWRQMYMLGKFERQANIDEGIEIG
ncbi:MAG: Rpn family recombination-promoting nuclease/putative transposase, partial [Synergistaceae bacterium]|nr:Rpn family recombination-promoting nuclease/putative transposase [Synergistaceae bacterium]